jgi:hypothetical protein
MDLTDMATLDNLGRPAFGVKYKSGKMSKEQRREMSLEWNGAYGGARKSGRIAVMDEDWDIVNMGWAPKDMEFKEGRPQAMKEVLSMWPMPVGFFDQAALSKAPARGIEGMDRWIAQYNTLPRLTRMEQKLNEKLVPRYDGRLFLAYDNPVTQDKEFELTMRDSDLDHGIITINNVLSGRGQEPVEWGDTPLLPMNIAPLGTTIDSDDSNNGEKALAVGTDQRVSGGLIHPSLKDSTIHVK